jgi:hypothetical protein
MQGRTFTDTSNFIAIDYGDQVLVDGKSYTILGHERESRFGMNEPKYWVKKAVENETGKKKIIKLAFFESFDTYLSGVKITRFRNPEKEGEILELVKDHPGFMHGTSHSDSKGNNIRILDRLRGENFFNYIDSLRVGYETYFRAALPGILKNLVRAFEAIRFLHLHGYKHGDIRNDHLIIQEGSDTYVWIDFDYDYATEENPFGLDLFGMGNLLLYAVGKGFHHRHAIDGDRVFYGDLIDRVGSRDFSILDRGRLVNLRMLYPKIPKALNNVLLHFSSGTDVYYEFAEELLEDLNRSFAEMPQ